jgi:L-seryl-tRNA(Ser) seleniumtransferase
LPAEPQVRDEIAAGADVVTFSADKLVGGPQAGLVVGTPAAIDRMSVDPIYRVVRCGRLTLAALAATLKLYHHPSRLGSDLPTLRYLTRTVEEMTDCARHAVAMLTVSLGAGYRVGLVKSESRVGGGALSAAALPSIAVCVEHEGKTGSEIAEIFRKSDPPILGRLEKGRFLLDLRMITDPQDLVQRRLDDR